MPDKSWKAAERAVARILGGERIAVSGRVRGHAPDIAHERLSLEIKHRRTIPRWIEDALSQAEASSRDGKLPVAVLHAAGRQYADALCVIRLEDLASYLTKPETKGDASE